MALVRLNKLLASWGLASRRAIEAMIAAGRIAVDGEVVADLGRVVDPEAVRIEVDGRPVGPPPSREGLVIAFHKPAGVQSTLHDPFGRPTLKDHLPRDRRLFPIGRLDADSTGLLLATDIGELANRLLHPRYKVEKEYEVTIDGPPLSAPDQARFAAGILLDDGSTAPCRLEPIGRNGWRVVLREGRKRQIKRMFAFFDRQVLTLHRVRFGPIRLGTLRPGETRPLTPAERARLLELTGLADAAAPGPSAPASRGRAAGRPVRRGSP